MNFASESQKCWPDLIVRAGSVHPNSIEMLARFNSWGWFSSPQLSRNRWVSATCQPVRIQSWGSRALISVSLLAGELDQMPRQAQARLVCTTTVSMGQQPFQVKLIASLQERCNFQEELKRADFKNMNVPIWGWFSASRTRDGGPGESDLIEVSSEALVLKL